MSFTFDTKSSGSGAGNPVTVAHTCSSSTKVLVVVIFGDGAARSGGAPSYNSVSMTDSGSGVRDDASSKIFTEIYYLINPSTGSSYNVSIPNSGSAPLYIHVASFEATGTVTKHANNDGAGSSANPSIDVATTVNNGLMVGALGHDANAPNNTPGANYTEIYLTDWGSEYGASEYDLDWGSSGSIAVNWTEFADDWGIIGLAFEEAAAGDLSVNVSDDVDVSDSVALNLPGYSLSVNVSDDVTATDSTTVFLPFLAVDIQDNATVTDTVDVDILTSIAVQDDATVTDTATVDIPFLVAVQDDATVTDTITVDVVVDITVQDDATATDSVTADIIINITAQDDATATDSVTVSVQAAGAVDVNVSDDATATDSVISYILLETSVQDDVTATDSATVQIEAELYLDLFISPQNNYVQIV